MKEYKICTSCKKELRIVDCFHKNKTSKDGHAWQCKKCSRKAGVRHENGGTVKSATYKYKIHIKRTYGITLEERNKILDSQNGCCAICKKPLSYLVSEKLKQKKLYIDHNHETGKIRGLLCSTCNTGLGMFKDNVEYLRNAITYLLKKL
jgi:hypothetical protein